VKYVLDFKATGDHWVITWSLDESEDYDRFGMEDGHGWMARLAPVRDELLRGDIRSLYIGWLASVTRAGADDDPEEESEEEPLAVKGLGDLTAAQQALAEFLEVDVDLLAGAGIGSPPQTPESTSQEQMDAWLRALPSDEVQSILKQLLQGQGLKAERALKNRYFAWQRNIEGDKPEASLRSVQELWQNSEVARKMRLVQEKRQQEQLALQRRQERAAYLELLAKDFPKAWKGIRQSVEQGSGLGYDEACRALVDLSEAYAAHASRAAFRQELGKFMTDHLRRKAFVQRLAKAGIWREK